MSEIHDPVPLKQNAIVDPAPSWQPERSRFVILWHGCTASDKDNIEANGIKLRYCRPDSDFGRGFYTTTVQRQAASWARLRQAQPLSNEEAVILRFRVCRNELSKLASLHFVLGNYDCEDYWSFVQHCRQSMPPVRGRPAEIRHHDRLDRKWYDVVTGPVSAFWRQRALMADSDQVSFHTLKAIKILNRLIKTGNPNYFWERVHSATKGE